MANALEVAPVGGRALTYVPTQEERLTVVEDILKDVVWAVAFILGFLLFVFILRR